MTVPILKGGFNMSKQKNNKTTRNYHLHLRLNANEKAILDDLCEENHVSASNIARYMIFGKRTQKQSHQSTPSK